MPGTILMKMSGTTSSCLGQCWTRNETCRRPKILDDRNLGQTGARFFERAGAVRLARDSLDVEVRRSLTLSRSVLDSQRYLQSSPIVDSTILVAPMSESSDERVLFALPETVLVKKSGTASSCLGQCWTRSAPQAAPTAHCCDACNRSGARWARPGQPYDVGMEPLTIAFTPPGARDRG